MSQKSHRETVPYSERLAGEGVSSRLLIKSTPDGDGVVLFRRRPFPLSVHVFLRPPAPCVGTLTVETYGSPGVWC